MNVEHPKSLLLEFIELLEIKEETDNGRIFHPNRISSVRVSDGAKMNELLTLLKIWANS
jgi:hypothetical protein